jgi:hypothetical protein
MTGPMDEREIDAMLHTGSVAHLACVLPDGRPYVVPVTYAFDGRALFVYTADGLKLHALRENPQVCLVVDDIIDAATWRSIVAWGHVRELHGAAAADALRRISDRLQTVALASHAPSAAEHSYVARTAPYGVAYRIDIDELTGRSYSDG